MIPVAKTPSPPLSLPHKSASPNSSDAKTTEEIPSSNDKVEFFVEDAPNTHLIWTKAPPTMKPRYIIAGDAYPESWGMDETLSKLVKEWYQGLQGKRKVLAVYCGQTKNDLKIERIKEAVENVTKYQVKDDDIEMLKNNSLWVTVFVESIKAIKLLLDTRAVMTVDRGDLVLFRPIANKLTNHIFVVVVANNEKTTRHNGYQIPEVDMT